MWRLLFFGSLCVANFVAADFPFLCTQKNATDILINSILKSFELFVLIASEGGKSFIIIVRLDCDLYSRHLIYQPVAFAFLFGAE